MKHYLLALLIFFSLGLFSTSFASNKHSATTPNHYQNNSQSEYGIQASIATGGNFGIGAVHYTPKAELGVAFSGSVDNAKKDTRLFTPVLFGGFRKALGPKTYFAYGLDLAATFGRDDGENIQSDYQIGPYISIEEKLSKQVLLAVWILPYQYQYEKKNHVSTSTNRFFNAGGIGLAYLF